MKWSASFSGANYLSAANFTGNPAAFSVSCWVNLAAAQLSRIFFSNFLTGGTNRGWAVGISDSTNNKIKFYLGSNTLFQAGTLTPGVWTHAVFTWDGTTARIYLNGSTTPDAALVSGVSYGAAPANNYVGSLDGTNQQVAGSLAAVGYWPRALAAAEVAALYGGGAGLLGPQLSGSLLTSLGAYYDFGDSAALGADSGGAGHAMTNTGAVAWSGAGPSGTVYGANPGPPAPAARFAAPAWRRGMLFALTPGRESGDPAGVRDALSGGKFPYLASPMTRASGPWGPELNSAHSGSRGVLFGTALQGSAAFTLSSLCRCDAYADLAHLWGGENTSSADMRVALSGTAGNLFFQLGADGAYPNLNVNLPLLEYVVLTCRLAPGGTRSVWLGPYKVAERTDAGIAYGAGVEVNGSGWGGSPQNIGRDWSGRLAAGYAWARALADAEIVALAADPFAPVRPAPARLGVLSPPSPTFEPVPWLRGVTAAPRAARLSVTPASGWAPGLAAAVDYLPWLRRAVPPAAPLSAPRAGLAPWSPAYAPASGSMAWLLRGTSAPPPEAPPLATAQAGWRPEFAGAFAPAVRHALVRFWRGPEARMPRLEDGEPAWATDTKSLWVGSASGNVRIGP